MSTAARVTGERRPVGKGAKEVRWIALCADGRHSTLGRHTDPSEEEVAGVEANLVAQGLSGWMAVMKGDYYARPQPELMMVRPLGNPAREFTEAKTEFEVVRRRQAAAVDGA